MTRTGMKPETLEFYHAKLRALREIKRKLEAEIEDLETIVGWFAEVRG